MESACVTLVPTLLAEFEVPGVPVQWMRPRVEARGSRKRVFVTAAKDSAHRNAIALIAATKCPKPTTAPVWLDLRFYLPLPKKLRGKAREDALGGFTRPKRPDLDNLAKAVADALIGIAYADDAQVAQLSAAKFYGAEPRTEIRIHALEHCLVPATVASRATVRPQESGWLFPPTE